MAPRANWKGTLRIDELACQVALFTAASTSDRIAFHILNRRTLHLVHREYLDGETGKKVPHDAQVKGYEDDKGDVIVLEQDEVAAAVPDADKTLSITAFVACDEIDTIYLDKPYYLAPADHHAAEVYALIRDGMRAKKVAALAQTVLFRRVRTLLIRCHGSGLIATTLSSDDEVRSATEAFADIPQRKIDQEMLDLARHIIKTKTGDFDPAEYQDRYEAALAELVQAKLAGKKILPRKAPKQGKVVDLMAALRASAQTKERASAQTKERASAGDKTAKGRRKTGPKAATPPKRKAG